MNMKTNMKTKAQEIEEAWRKGYDLGVKNTLHTEKEAIKIGQAILEVLDNRYEFAEEDY